MAATCLWFGSTPMLATLRQQPSVRGPMTLAGEDIIALQRLSTDAAGVAPLVLSNVVVGSRYRIENESDGALVAEGEAAAAIVNLTINYYTPARTVRIKVRKASASPAYRPYETLAPFGAAGASVYIAQELDE